jgi:hypothetical protein
MKKLLLLCVLFLSGCFSTPKVLNFDSNEYAIISDIKTAAIAAKPHCGTKSIVPKLSELQYNTLRARIYTEMPETNREIYDSVIEIENIVSETHIRHLNEQPSKYYCEKKLDNIIISSDIIRKHLASRRPSHGINY